MNDPGTDYKAKSPFWKWKPKEKEKRHSSSPHQKDGSFWTSWGGSLFIHTLALLLLLSAVRFRNPNPKEVRGRPEGSVGIVFFDEKDEPEADDSEDAVPNEESAPDTAASDPSPETQSEDDPFIGIGEKKEPAAVVRIKFTETSSPDNAESKNGLSPASPSPSKGTGQSVGFGSLNGKGKRFVYILDRSESMRYPDNLPIDYAIREAAASIESLDPGKGAQKFQVIVYNHHTALLDNRKRLLDVTPANKERAVHFLRGQKPDGGTDPLEALDTGIRLAPDVIFFLTDAEEEISPILLSKIRETARQGGVSQIHVIEFRKPNGKKLKSFQKLAEQNNGTYLCRDLVPSQAETAE